MVARLTKLLSSLTAAAIALLWQLAPAMAQSEQASAEARLVLVTPLSFIKEYDLEFGSLVAGDTAGTVTLNPDSTVQTTGGVQVISGTIRPARFHGFGSFRQNVLINLDANSYLLQRQGGTETMRLDRITIGSTPPTRIFRFPRRFFIGANNGYFNFDLGGRLTVAANQTPGTYQTTFRVTLAYQ